MKKYFFKITPNRNSTLELSRFEIIADTLTSAWDKANKLSKAEIANGKCVMIFSFLTEEVK